MDGDINNVCWLCEAAIIFKDINLDICSDFKNYSGIYWDKENINFIENIDELDLNRAHCVMTDVFISMNDHEDKSKEENLKKYQVNSKIMEGTNEIVFFYALFTS